MSMMCPDCASQMPDNAAYCPECGRAAVAVERAHGMVGVLPETLAGALAYFLLPAIVFLLIDPYKKDRFVRFHSFQCIGFLLCGVILGAVLRLMGLVLYLVPMLGHLLVWLVSMVVTLAFLMSWIVVVVKALQGEMFRLPLVGKLAAAQDA